MIAVYLLLLLSVVGIIFFAFSRHHKDIGKLNIVINTTSLLLTIWLAITVFFIEQQSLFD